MNTPPCPMCGTPLRWFPDNNAWGCDRCRQLIQPHQLQVPQAAHAMAPPPRQPRAAGGGKKKTLIIAGVAGAAAIAAVIVAVVMLTGGGGATGAATPEALAKAGIAAMTSGDASAYIALSPMKAMSSVVDCKYADDLDMGDASFAKYAVMETKGAKLVIDSVKPKDDEDKMTLEAGKRFVESCYLKQQLAFHTFTIKMKEGSDKDEVAMTAWHLGDRWYLLYFGDLPKKQEMSDEVKEEAEKLMEESKKKRLAKFRSSAGGSPEAAVKTVIEGAVSGSTTRAKAVAILEDDLEAIMSCSGESEIADRAKRSDNLIDAFTSEEGRDDGDGDKRDRKKVEIKSVKVGQKGKTASGDEFRGECTAQKAFEWADLELEIDDGGKAESVTAVAIKVDGQWRVLYVN